MYEIRRATPDDLEVIVEHRRAMFADMGSTDEGVLQSMSDAFRPWLAERLASGNYVAWFATSGGQVVSGAGVWIIDWPPTMADLTTRRAMVLNVYTKPPHRRRGLARKLMQTAIEWCRAEGFRTIHLHASKAGRPVYEQLGFFAANEMRLELPPT